MSLATLVLVVMAAAEAPAPSVATATATAPKHLLIVAGAREQPAAAEMLAKAASSKVGAVFKGLGFKLLKSDEVAGLKPGFFVVTATACGSKEEAERLLDIFRADYEDAYLREVTDTPSLPACPSLVDRELPNKRYRQVGKAKVMTRTKTLRWMASTASMRNPVFKDAPYKGTILRVLSGDTTIAYRSFEPENHGETTDSYEYKGMAKGQGREWPVLAQAGSWHAGDTCSDGVYVFREGGILAVALVEDNGCDADPSEWRVTGSIDAPVVTAPAGTSQCPGEEACVLYRSQWDPVSKRYRNGGLEL